LMSFIVEQASRISGAVVPRLTPILKRGIYPAGTDAAFLAIPFTAFPFA
jgi:hypothetical protein